MKATILFFLELAMHSAYISEITNLNEIASYYDGQAEGFIISAEHLMRMEGIA